ncbi:MAG: caspase family protein [Elusimicrobiota bacterium]
MSKRTALPVVLAAVVFAGCAIASRREDPMAGIGMKKLEYGKTKLAVIVSQNTKNWIRSYNKLRVTSPGTIHGDVLVDDLIAVIDKQFGAVHEMASAEQAREAGAQLVGILDITGKAHVSFDSRAEIDLSFFVFQPDETPVEQLRFNILEKSGKRMSAMEDFYVAAYRHCMVTAKTRLAEEITASVKLRPYRKDSSAAPAPPAAVAAAPPQTVPAAKKSAVDDPNYSLPQNPKLFAMVVGIESYQALPRADYAEGDADAVRAHLRALGYPDRNIIHLTGQRATISGLKKYLEEWLPKNVKADSSLLFYFSGHGAPNPQTGEAYLIPWDGDAKFLKTTAYPLKKLYAQLNATQARRILVALDACFSGAGGRSVLARGARPLVTTVELGQGERERLSLLAAASGDEITTTLEQERHGIFTYFFLKGLNGPGRDGSGQVTARSLFEYLKPNVQDEARRQNRDQSPAYLPGVSGEFRLR